ncbi:MAG TPA: hypothetical protein VI932_02385 [Bacteroidota bacterium]|nr:hypothetical protein [Bacteroidota bacterium]
MRLTGKTKELTFQQLLDRPIRDLDLRPADALRECLIALRHELFRNKIAFFPHFYFGDEPWGCIDGTGSIEVPFYLANSQLWKLSDRYYIPYSKKEVMMVLRHETGHALNYVYRLWKDDEWNDLFGNFRTRYPSLYHFDSSSRDFVRYLHYIGNPHYAQKHPDDDFAETVAVWLDPQSKWRWNYRDWPRALEKLRYVDRIFRKEKVAARRPSKFRTDERDAYTALASTVAEYFAIERKVDPRIREYTTVMKQVFPSISSLKGNAIRADRFIQNYAEYIESELVTWIPKAKKREVSEYVREIQTICAINDLALRPNDATEKLIEVVIVSTLALMKRLKIIR